MKSAHQYNIKLYINNLNIINLIFNLKSFCHNKCVLHLQLHCNSVFNLKFNLLQIQTNSNKFKQIQT